jgi:hypothetical protein
MFTGGCGTMLGVDGYTIGESNPCGPLEVRLPGGSCARVGTLDADCPNGFAAKEGACLPLLPEAPCARGSHAIVGDGVCESVDLACGSDAFGIYEPSSAGVRVYVRAGATGTGDARDSPLATVAAGVARAKEVGAANVWIASGTYDEPIVIDAPITLNGTCPSMVTIHSTDPNRPAVKFTAGADGGGLSRLSITGGSTGVQITGVSKITLDGVWVTDVAGPGVVFEDQFEGKTPGPSVPLGSDAGPPSTAAAQPAVDAGAGPAGGGSFSGGVVGVKGAGVAVWGADVAISSLSVRDVSPLSDALPGQGIAVHPSAVSYPSWKPRRSTVTVIRTLVSDVVGAGILVEGSDVTVKESVVSGVGPDPRGKGRGIVVQPRAAGNVGASLEADHVLVERTHDVGVLVWSSRATLNGVTIRDTGVGPASAAQGETCIGNGVRVRLDTVAHQTLDEAPDRSTLVAIKRSVIERARESAVHVEGARVDIDDSILRGTLPDRCEGKFGDGVAAYSQPGWQADVRLTRTRVDGSARAAVASFGSRTTLASVVLGCNASGIGTSSARDPVFADPTSLCGCGGSWARCAAESRSLPSALRPGPGCADGGVCVSYCVTDWFGGFGLTRIPNLSLWDADDERAPTAFTDKAGCAELRGAPGSLRDWASSAPGYANAINRTIFPTSSGTAGLIRDVLFGNLFLTEGPGTWGHQFDFRKGYLVSLQVCEDRSGAVSGDTEWCNGHGIVGVTAELAGYPRGAYVNPGLAPQPDLLALTTSSYVTWQNIEPGDHLVLLRPPAGSTGLDCAAFSATPSGRGPRLEGTNPVKVPISVRAGTLSNSVVMCRTLP